MASGKSDVVKVEKVSVLDDAHILAPSLCCQMNASLHLHFFAQICSKGILGTKAGLNSPSQVEVGQH